jgi:hypothetical protein
MMTTGTDVLEEILEGQNKGKPKGISYEYKALNKKQQNMNFAYALEDYGIVSKQKQVQDIKFVAAETYDPTISKPMLQHPEEHQSSKSKKISRPWVCHYCRRKGHIRPFCFKLYGYPKRSQQKPPEPEVSNVKKEWKPKCDNVGLIVHTSLRASSMEDWYFDSACSRHMTGVDKFLEDVRPYASSCVTSGDGTKRYW